MNTIEWKQISNIQITNAFRSGDIVRISLEPAPKGLGTFLIVEIMVPNTRRTVICKKYADVWFVFDGDAKLPVRCCDDVEARLLDSFAGKLAR